MDDGISQKKGIKKMKKEETKNAKHQQYVEEEKKRRSRIKKIGKVAVQCAIVAGTAITTYVLGKKSQGNRA